MDSLSFFRDNDFLLNEEIISQLKTLSQFTGKETSLISLSKTADRGMDYTFISKGNPDQIKTDSLKNKAVETFTYDSFSIKKFSLENVTFFTSHRDGILITSNSRSQLESILGPAKEKVNNRAFDKLFAAADKSKNSLFIKHEEFKSAFKNSFPGSALPLSKLAGWSVMEIELIGQKILLNGISSWEPENKAMLEAFINVNPVPNQLAEITPTSAAGFYSVTYNNFEKLHSNLQAITEFSSNLTENHFLNFTQEAGVIFLSEENVIAFTATDVELARQAITQNNELITEFRNIPVYRFNETPQILMLLDPLVKGEEYLLFAYIGDFILLAKSTNAIEEIIIHTLNKTILAEQDFFQDAMSHLASSSSFLMVANSKNIKNRLKKTVSDNIEEEINSLNLENYPILALQFVQEGDFAHLHGILNTTRATSSSSVKQISAFNTDAPIATTPFLLTHTNNTIEIAVQDDNNDLYLFNAAGKRLWKTNLEGRITGQVHQVAGSRNANLQLVFSTQNVLYILDRTGKPVKPFPLTFKDDITQPLAVFDYDNNGNYRYVITQDKEVLMYDAKGAIVKGFDFGKASSTIVQAPKHIRMKNKDYIVVPESSGKLNILSRQGTLRVKVQDELDFSENQWYSNNGNFTSITSKGEIIRIDETGGMQKQKMEGIPDPYLTATEEVMVFHSENMLKINNNTVNLDFGLYTKPEIFTFANKIYISLTDTQAERVFVFNEKAELLPGFPVYGNSAATIANTGKNKNVLSVRGDENVIILYEF